MLPTRTNRHAVAALVTTAAVLVPATAGAHPHTHEVQPGDTLTAIAGHYGVAVDRLRSANGLDVDPHLIHPGDLLAIPPDATGATATGGLEHTVVAGDTLWSLARSHGTTVEAIAALNALADVDLVGIGQVLQIPETPTPGVTAVGGPTTTPAPAGTDPSTYVVRSGDTYWGIAMAHGISVSTLLEVNHLTQDTVLREGRRLTMPAEALGTQTPAAAPPTAEAPPPAVSEQGPLGLPGPLLADPSRLALQPVFDRWADANGVPRDLLKALAWYESGWNNGARSSAGAIGIGQILPVTADFVANQLIGVPLDPTQPEDNIRLSARYLRYLMDQTGDERLAIAAYYQGLTAVRVHGVFASSEHYVNGVQALRQRFS